MKCKFKPNDLLLINWVDQSYQYGPLHSEDALLHCHGQTIGHFISEDKDWFCTGGEKFNTSNGYETYRHIVTLPKCAITQIRKLK